MTRIVSKEDSEIRLSERGLWFHQNKEFENEKVIQFFHHAIRRDDAGNYYLNNSFDGKTENVYFEVEDTAYFVWEIDFDEQAKQFHVTLNTGETSLLELRTLNDDERGVMYCTVLEGSRARFSPRSLMKLSEHAVMQGDEIYIDKTGEKIVLSRT
jgi:hypothetical protein